MSIELPIQQEREEALAYCEQEHITWLPAYRRMERAGGHNAEANAAFDETNRRMDFLLEDLFRLTVVLELSHDK